MINEPTPFPSIKTEISDFCQEFADLLAPYEGSLKNSLKSIQGKADCDTLQRPLAGLADVHHRVETLLNKVKEQQAYVIIFGPLKSGKSTLMNAISATYVSEVTSLPAYPCLVNVKYGDEYKFVVSRYNGDKIPYADNRSLQMLIQDSHKTLADRVREVEEAGEEFDPGVHYPDAIRRIDVEIPARNLKDSLTVLVDTPGLYTRMKFGYDLMTREFRNSAACAVFVVKTDNLFLEQVFDEFNDLLDLFSRIFLVVNIDTNKRDLEPDGSLKPSLESESPQEVIKAFESLVMSAPLRKAAEEGRLRIYPIDLLNSAAASLKPAQAASASGDDDSSNSESDAEAVLTGDEADSDPDQEESSTGALRTRSTADHPVESFSVFLNDLTDYLNSNDYLHEFMGDSLYQGKTLAAEIQSHCSSKAIEAFRERQSNLRRELAEAGERLAAVEELESLDWLKAFNRVRRDSNHGAEIFGKKIQEETEQQALVRLDEWFESDESVADLQKSWDGFFETRRREIQEDCASRARNAVSSALGGVEIDPKLRRSIDRLESIMEPAVGAARGALENAAIDVPDCSLRIPPEAIKVKKGFWDWVLFRTQASVRRRVVGGDNLLDRPLPSAAKKKRLGDEGKEELKQTLISHLSGLFPGEAVKVSEGLLSVYIDTLSQELRQKLQSGKNEYSAKKEQLEARLEDNRQIQEHLDRLTRESGAVIDSIYSLKEKFRAVNWESRDITADAGEESDEEIPEDEDALALNREDEERDSAAG